MKTTSKKSNYRTLPFIFSAYVFALFICSREFISFEIQIILYGILAGSFLCVIGWIYFFSYDDSEARTRLIQREIDCRNQFSTWLQETRLMLEIRISTNPAQWDVLNIQLSEIEQINQFRLNYLKRALRDPSMELGGNPLGEAQSAWENARLSMKALKDRQ